MSLGARYQCPVCDGYIGEPARRMPKSACRCPELERQEKLAALQEEADARGWEAPRG